MRRLPQRAPLQNTVAKALDTVSKRRMDAGVRGLRPFRSSAATRLTPDDGVVLTCPEERYDIMLKHRRTPQAASRVERWPHDDLDPSKACENHYEDTCCRRGSAVKQVVEEVVRKFLDICAAMLIRIDSRCPTKIGEVSTVTISSWSLALRCAVMFCSIARARLVSM